MGSVDKADQCLEPYSYDRKSIAWFKKLGIHFWERMVLNAFLLYRGQNPEYKADYLTFSQSVAEGLIMDHSVAGKKILQDYYAAHPPRQQGGTNQPEDQPDNQNEDIPPAITEYHHLTKIPPTAKKQHPAKVCRQCSYEGEGRRETSRHCDVCPGKPGLHEGDCFNKYHMRMEAEAALVGSPLAHRTRSRQGRRGGRSNPVLQTAPQASRRPQAAHQASRRPQPAPRASRPPQPAPQPELASQPEPASQPELAPQAQPAPMSPSLSLVASPSQPAPLAGSALDIPFSSPGSSRPQRTPQRPPQRARRRAPTTPHKAPQRVPSTPRIPDAPTAVEMPDSSTTEVPGSSRPQRTPQRPMQRRRAPITPHKAPQMVPSVAETASSSGIQTKAPSQRTPSRRKRVPQSRECGPTRKRPRRLQLAKKYSDGSYQMTDISEQSDIDDPEYILQNLDDSDNDF